MQEATDFTGSLDLDSDEKEIAPGDYIYALNLRNTDGVARNIRGSKHINNSYLPAGRNKCIGSFPQDEEQRIIYFNWNSNEQHGIYAYYPLDDTISEVWVNKLLGFTEDDYITHIGLLPIFKDGQKQWIIYYTNNVVSPRSFNLDEIATMLPDPELYEERFVTLVKVPPIIPLKVSLMFEFNGPNVRNLLGKKVYTFIYRYVYRDFQKSRWSAESQPISVAYSETERDTSRVYNTIRYDWGDDLVDFATGGPANRYRQLIDSIEIAVKDGINQPYRLIKRIKIEAGDQKFFDTFKNDNTYPVVPVSIDQYDSVPDLSGCLTIIDNRVILGDNTEGFPFVNVWVTENADIVLDGSAMAENGNRMSFKNNSKNQIGFIFFDEANRSTGVYAPEELKVNTPYFFNRNNPTIFGKRFRLDATYLPPKIKAFQFCISENQDVSFFIQGVANEVSYIKDTTNNDGQVAIKRQIGTTGIKNKDGVFVQRLSGEQNYRVVGSLGSNSKTYDLDTPIFEGGVDIDGKKMVVIRKETGIFNGGEDDMRNEAIGRTADGTLIYFEGYDSAPTNLDRKPITEFTANVSLGDTRYLGINIANWYSSSRKSGEKTYPNNQQYYNFQEGDRVDIISTADGQPVGLLSLPIIKFENNILLVPVTKELLSQTSYVLGPGAFIEIFKPKKASEQSIFYEVGPRYKVIDGKIPNLEFEVTQGGVHVINKQMFADGFESSDRNFVFSMNPDENRVFDTWETGLGRPNFVPETQERVIRRFNQLRASERLIEDSLVNGTSSFSGLLQFTYPAEYGFLTKLYNIQNNQVREAGNVLMAEFSREKVSIYIGRTLLQAGANSLLAESDKVFGSFNTLEGSFGSIHPSGSTKVDSRNYSWDAFKGCVVRYSNDGLTPISRFKARKFFYNLSRTMKDYQVVSAFDYANDELLITFLPKKPNVMLMNLPPVEQPEQKALTIAWNEVQNRWKTFYSFTPEYYGTLGPTLVYFIEGKLYRYEAGDKSNTFHGEKYDTEVEIVLNKAFPNKMIYQNVSIVSTDKWFIPRMLGDNVAAPGRIRQESLLNLEHFKEEEAAFVAAIGKNIKTANAKSEDNAFLNGEEMRSSILRILVKLNPQVDYESFLYALAVDSAPSNPKTINTNE